ncbi:MAG: hypothetical protein ACRC1H_10655 [Caldilineaceae bacterium]
MTDLQQAAARHLDKARHNQELSQLLGSRNPNHYLDWQITTLFYAALHLVQAYFVQYAEVIPRTHVQRSQFLMKEKRLLVYKPYVTLHDLSRDGRYLLEPMSESDLAIANESYAQIAAAVAAAIAPPDEGD